MVDRQAILNLLEKHEGFRASAYRDTTGHLTIGIGFNLDAPGAQRACELAGLDYQALRNGRAITYQQSGALLEPGVEHAIDVATILVAGFQELPANAQLVIVDMIFEMGAHGFAGFHNTIAALEARNWIGAAEGMTNSPWYHEVPNRAKDDIALILQLAG